jgi:hypothetical protein
MGESPLSTADIAQELGTTARNLRKFLRSPQSPYEAVGQGSRYNISSADLAELKTKFETWVSRPGSRSASGTTSVSPSPSGTKTRAARRPKTKSVDKVNPLDEDDLMERLTTTVADRQRKHGLICSYNWKHPKVRGLDVKCSHKTIKGTKFCPEHQQLFFCGDKDTPVDNYCGPGGRHAKPYCQYHNADISDEELEAYLALPIEQRDY